MEGKSIEGLNMKRSLAYIVFAVFIMATLGISCGDGSHRDQSTWTLSPGDDDDLSQDQSVVTLDCVNVVNYEDMKASELAAPSTPPENLTPGDVTSNSVKATVAMSKLAGGVDAETKALRSCIKSEIANMNSSGSNFYWGNMTWLVTRSKLSKKPSGSTVRIIELTGCDQVKTATCLLTD